MTFENHLLSFHNAVFTKLLIVGLFFLMLNGCQLAADQKANDQFAKNLIDQPIVNPILPGFNPDPCITRAGDDYYIVTSSFEWFPGIPIYHSRDLVHWQMVDHVLKEKEYLDLAGVPNSRGIYAPAMRYHEGKFYVVFTIVKGDNWALRPTLNYLTTADNIHGPWSEPVYLHGAGIDPSIFFDEDGKVYLVWNLKGIEPEEERGIAVQEYAPQQQKLVGDHHLISRGTWMGGHGAEGPHLYKHYGYYYLMTAEGGTGYNHGIVMYRSKDVFGPYEVDPDQPLLTSYYDSTAVIQKAGHGSLVETTSGEWYITHLGSRPLTMRGKNPLGRETNLQKVQWTEDGWLDLVQEVKAPLVKIPPPELPAAPLKDRLIRDEFEGEQLQVIYQTPREPVNQKWLRIENGKLKLKGRNAPTAYYGNSLIARRLTSFEGKVSTSLIFAPASPRHRAGITAFYNNQNFIYLYISHQDTIGNFLSLMQMEKGNFKEPLAKPIPYIGNQVDLRIVFAQDSLQFHYKNNSRWQPAGPKFPLGLLSDDYVKGYTGLMVGVAAQDMLYREIWAEFDWFEYEKTSNRN